MQAQTPPADPELPDYELLSAQVAELAEGEGAWLGVLANASALLYEALDDVNWLGFYLVEAGAPAPSDLLLGPFQGGLACQRIPTGRGVCGTAVATDATQCVDDVHAFAGHIACDAASRSEIVIPLHANGKVVGVLDVDSPILARFTPRDQAGLEYVVHALEATGVLSSLASP